MIPKGLNRRVVGLIVGFIILIALATYFSRFRHTGPVTASAVGLGEIKEVRGEAFMRTPESPELTPMNPGPLKLLETLQTGNDGIVRLQLDSGAEFELEPDSKFVLERDANGDVLNLVLLEGELKLLTLGTASAYRVYKNGKIISEQDLLNPPPQMAAQIKPGSDRKHTQSITAAQGDEAGSQAASATATPSPTPGSAHRLGDNGPSETLSRDEINHTIRGQTSFLHRCYINYMVKAQKPNLKGAMSIAFRIDPNGSTKNVRIVQTPYADETLNRCLINVLERTKFTTFQGKPIEIEEYPLSLD